MKKKLFTLFLFLGIISLVQASPRSIEQMKAAAAAVLSQTSKAKADGHVLVTSNLKVLDEMSEVTLIGADNGAFAVIANDDSFDALLGYTDVASNINAKDNANFMWWLETINESLAENLKAGAQPVQIERNAEYKSSVSELLTTKWGQSAPYNNLTPTYTDGSHYVTGCVATAMAQIMNYHEWPVKGYSSSSYRFTPVNGQPTQRVAANFANTTYDWANMLDDYSGTYTDEQATAVATLMFHCGASVQMQYTPTGSGSYTFSAADALRDNFYYDKYPKFYARTFMPIDEWMDIIYKELNENRPVLYGGQSTSGGHEFVFDGYDSNGFVHVNWGWNGSQNGFFSIATLNGFKSSQDMLVVRKQYDESIFQSLFGLANDISVSNGLSSSSLDATCSGAYNLNIDKFSGNFALIAQDKNDASKAANVLATSTKTVEVEGYGVGGYLYKTDISFKAADVSKLADGTYRVYFASKADAEANWQPIRANESYTNSYLLTIASGKISSLTNEKNPNWTTPTGINTIKNTTSTQNNGLVRVYDMSGRQVYSSQSSAFSIHDIPSNGVLIIKKGNEVTKIVK